MKKDTVAEMGSVRDEPFDVVARIECQNLQNRMTRLILTKNDCTPRKQKMYGKQVVTIKNLQPYKNKENR